MNNKQAVYSAFLYCAVMALLFYGIWIFRENLFVEVLIVILSIMVTLIVAGIGLLIIASLFWIYDKLGDKPTEQLEGKTAHLTVGNERGVEDVRKE